MSNQKSKAEYIGIPVGIRLSEAPLPSPIEVCLWHSTGECSKSGLREFIKKDVYDGLKCKCYAYVPHKYIEGDYQI